jgi:hypothetical protein
MEQILEQAGMVLSESADALRLPFQFVPVQAAAEDLTPGDWINFRRFKGELFATATFSLHHIGRDASGSSRKDPVLRNLKRIAPTAFVLSEANGDFEADDLVTRFAETWTFYGSCFDILDRMVLPHDLRAAANLFFGRELEDILGSHSAHRCERFDTVARWQERLRNAGFEPHPCHGQDSARWIGGVADDLMTPVVQDDLIGFAYGENIVSAVMCVR